MNTKIGQIILGTIEGDLIYNLSKREDVKTIFEIGTWTGLGSTMCVIKGIIDSRKKKKFISLELYNEMFQIALKNLKRYKNRVELINGRIIDYEDTFWFDHTKIDFKTDYHARLYYNMDMNYLKNSENVIDKIPEQIDLLILDGGEYTTYPEWLKLKDRSRIVVLDDTNILKTKKIRDEIILSEKYNIIHDDTKSRNGFSVFEKKNN
jgi:hypothetical protein